MVNTSIDGWDKKKKKGKRKKARATHDVFIAVYMNAVIAGG